MLQQTRPAPLQPQYQFDEFGNNALNNVAFSPALAPIPYPDDCMRHPETCSDTFERPPFAPRHDTRPIFTFQSPSPSLKRLGSKDSLDGHNVSSRSRLEKGSFRRQEGSVPSPSTQSMIKLGNKRSPDKKQTLACLFCRERKIACGRPAEGSPDHTCK